MSPCCDRNVIGAVSSALIRVCDQPPFPNRRVVDSWDATSGWLIYFTMRTVTYSIPSCTATGCNTRSWILLPNYLCFVVPCWNSHTSAFSSVDKVKLSWPAKVIMRFTCISSQSQKLSEQCGYERMWKLGQLVWGMINDWWGAFKPGVGEDGFYILSICCLSAF